MGDADGALPLLVKGKHRGVAAVVRLERSLTWS